MQRIAPRPCFFIISRARSVRYLRRRSQLTRCCQSKPAMPKFAPMNVSLVPREPRERYVKNLAGPSRRGQSNERRIQPKEQAFSGRVGARIGLQPRRRDARDGTFLVVLGGVAGNADRANDIATRVLNEHAAGHWHEASLAHGRECRVELRLARGAARERARAESHAERAPGFAERNVEAQDAGLVLALEGDEVAACIEHGDCKRRELGLAPGLERDADEGGGRVRGMAAPKFVGGRTMLIGAKPACHRWPRLAQWIETVETSSRPE